MHLKHKKYLFLWLYVTTGLASLIWFLIRVVPKPSRALYPCQRVAAPVAGGFIAWLLGMFVSFVAFRKAKQLFRQYRLTLCVVCLCVAAVAGIIALINSPGKTALACYPPSHPPIGVARGLHPGRVVWIHDPNATNWAGWQGVTDKYWFDNNHTDPCVVSAMFSKAIRSYVGASTDAEAWDAIFHYFNRTKGKGNVGYTPGEKIAIKINMVTCIYWNHAVNGYMNKEAWLKNIDASPQIIRAVLWQLVNVVGMAQSDIAVGDTLDDFPNQWYNPLHNEFNNVVYFDHNGIMGRTLAVKSTDPNNKIYFGNHGSLSSERVTCFFADANYAIDLATLKGHSAGMTLCGKNWFGSLSRYPGEWGYLNLHPYLPRPGESPGTGRYRPIVDLMGNKFYGGNTILYMMDGLYSGYYYDATPYKWQMPPFNNDWPSSIFLSMDPVAIDSVGYDFINREWPNIIAYGNIQGTPPDLQGGAEDYLHEAALADNPPSGTDYNPNGLGGPGPHLASLGTHEHWADANNDKQYSRNLGTGDGIELFVVDANNSSPWVNAGPDQQVAFIANLHGTVSDDGLPNPPGNIEVSWYKVSGPGTVTFDDENALDVNAAFSEVGIYVLRLIADDGALGSCDEVTITAAGVGPNGLASYEPVETHLSVTTDANKDPSLTATWPVLGGVNNVPQATVGNNVLKLTWTAETDRKIEVEHDWSWFTFNLAGRDYLLADVYFADESSLPQTIKLCDDVFGSVSAESVPCSAGQWYTIAFSVANLDYIGLNRIHSFVFEGLAGNSGTIYIDNLRFGTIADINLRMITFGGQNWWVKDSGCGISSISHPNSFSDSNSNVWVDSNGYLHLKITHVGDKWYSSEVVSANSPGYGTYVFTIKGRIDLLDPNVVFGLFTWDTNAPQYNYGEMDLEFSTRLHDTNGPNDAQYAIQPQNITGNSHRFPLDCSSNDVTTHEFSWHPDELDFESYYGDYPLSNGNNMIQSWSYTGNDIPPTGGENIRIGLWLLPPENSEPNSPGGPPGDGQEVEIVVKSFQHLMQGDLNGDENVDFQDLFTFTDAWLAEPGSPNWNPNCNLAQPQDGIINGNDFAVWAEFWMEWSTL